jgi:periplasmic protein CpxP/Spy
MRITSLVAAVTISLVMTASLGAQTANPQPRRAVLEQQLRERVGAITRQRLQLDDAQMSKLQSVNARLAPQMAALATQERQTRQQLRTQLISATPDQNQVATLLDTVLRLQKQRIALLESEQKDLAAFLTPVQRAKYMALQIQIRRRADQLRGGASSGARRRAGNPPPR